MSCQTAYKHILHKRKKIEKTYMESKSPKRKKVFFLFLISFTTATYYDTKTNALHSTYT